MGREASSRITCWRGRSSHAYARTLAARLTALTSTRIIPGGKATPVENVLEARQYWLEVMFTKVGSSAQLGGTHRDPSSPVISFLDLP